MSERPTTVIENLGIGRKLVVDSDPDGGRVVIEKRATRYYEVLHDIGVITDDQRTACSLLTDNYAWARLVSDVKACGQSSGDKSARSEKVATKAAAAWERHKHCMNNIGAAKALVIRAVVLGDETLASVGGRLSKPLTTLENALDALVVYCQRGNLDTLS